MPANWPDLALAIALALVAAYILTNLAARAVRSMLHAIVPDDREGRFIQGPGRAIHVFLFLIIATGLSFPALSLAGYKTSFARDRDELIRWLLDSGERIAIIAVLAYLTIRIGATAARRFEREMSSGTGLEVIERTKRAQTLARLMQRTLTVVVTVIAGLMILREFDYDIGPAITGFGVVGVALGFGAQTLIRDLIAGFFMIAEDQVRVGDSAVVNGQGGLVEEVNLRVRRIIAGDLRERLPHRNIDEPFSRLAGIVNRMLDELETTIHALAGVGNDIAHDLRTPLTRARLTLERGRTNATSLEQLQEAADKAIAGIDQSLSIVTALLRLAEIENSRRSSAFGDVELGEMLREVCDMYEPIAEDKQIALSVGTSRNLKP